MADLPFDPDHEPGPDSDAIEPVTPRSRRLVTAIAIVLIVVTVLTGLAGVGLIRFQPTTYVAPSASPNAQPVTVGMLAVVDPAGAIVTMNADGRSVARYVVQSVTFAFPAWSPDGTRFAAIGNGVGDAAVYVFSVSTADGGAPRRSRPRSRPRRSSTGAQTTGPSTSTGHPMAQRSPSSRPSPATSPCAGHRPTQVDRARRSDWARPCTGPG